MELLSQILRDAAKAGVDSVHFEWESEGLEIMFRTGNTGFGSVLSDRPKASTLLQTIIDLAGLQEKGRGKFKMTLNGNEYTIQARQYESFDETCFELKFVKPKM